jgi:predicted RNase H-like nuclease (RuvC/YqgF family)
MFGHKSQNDQKERQQEWEKHIHETIKNRTLKNKQTKTGIISIINNNEKQLPNSNIDILQKEIIDMHKLIDNLRKEIGNLRSSLYESSLVIHHLSNKINDIDNLSNKINNIERLIDQSKKSYNLPKECCDDICIINNSKLDISISEDELIDSCDI